jgi:hypothetical protein
MKSIHVEGPGVLDAAFNPALPFTYIAVGDFEAKPFFQANCIVEIDETRGKAIPHKGIYAVSLAIDPGGRRLYVQTPTWGSTPPDEPPMPARDGTVLLSCDLTSSSWPVVTRRAREEPGPAGVFAFVSPDGALVASLPGASTNEFPARRLLVLNASEP